jgi:hypothetical protein
MNLQTLPHLCALDKKVVAAIGQTPFKLMLDRYNYPSDSAVTRICTDVGLDPLDYYDRLEVYLSLKASRMKLMDREAA